MINSQPKDLSGDPVYDFLKGFTLPSKLLVGARIIVNKVAGPKEPRKIIAMTVQDKKSGKQETISYSYNKIMRSI